MSQASPSGSSEPSPIQSETSRSLPRETAIQRSTSSTIIVMVCTFLSRILGFIRIAVQSALFGATGEADVLNAVFTIPNNLRKLLAEGALSSAFIPVLSATHVTDSSGMRAKRITRNILSLQLVILVPLLVLSVVFSDQIVRFLLNFQDPALQKLASELFRWLIHYLLLISVSAVLMGVLNSHSRFFIPALTPIFFSIAVISALILFYRSLGIFAMAVGVLAGGLGQFLFQFPTFRRLGYDVRPDFRFDNEDFRKIMKQWLPVVITASVFTVNQQIAIWFASGLEEGSTTALSYAIVFEQLPFGIFSASITTVLFPRMSRQAAANDVPGLRESVQYGLRFLMVLLVPSSIILSLLSKETVAIALQNGMFGPESTLVTASVLVGYSVGLFGVGAFSFLQRFFYAYHDFKVPLIAAIVTCSIDVLLSLWLKETRLRVTGLALANSISFMIGFTLLLVTARTRLERIEGRRILVTAGKVLLSSFPLAAFLLAFSRLSGQWWILGATPRTLLLFAVAGVGSVLVVGAMYVVLRVEMISDFLKRRSIR